MGEKCTNFWVVKCDSVMCAMTSFPTSCGIVSKHTETHLISHNHICTMLMKVTNMQALVMYKVSTIGARVPARSHSMDGPHWNGLCEKASFFTDFQNLIQSYVAEIISRSSNNI